MSPPVTIPPRAGARGSSSARVLVVDDCEASRNAVEATLAAGGHEVVGSAGDGEEGLRLALQLRPDCVCLDLDMPRMDGFTFLRLLMARQPTPVLVIAQAARKQEVFKALELGALDVLVVPAEGDLGAELRQELLAKLALMRALTLGPRGAVAPPSGPIASREGTVPSRVAVLGASTGGPGALASLLAAVPAGLPLAWAVAQHMPENFTAGFAERLARGSGLDVREAQDGDEVREGRVLLAPGGRHLRLVRTGGLLSPVRACVALPDKRDGLRYCPSVDMLFASAAVAFGARVCAVVLTGMGNDGRRGVEEVKAAGGLAFAESEETAVVYGMPKEAVETGKVDEVLSLTGIVDRLCRFAEDR
jgi:two-component system, chemotaxis family, protein-glutamate methylesterase/glutaminase